MALWLLWLLVVTSAGGSGEASPVPRGVPGSPRAVPEPRAVPGSPRVVPEPPREVPGSPREVPEPPREVPGSPRVVPEPPRAVPEPPREVPGSPRAVSDAELRELSEQLLAADSNRAGPGQLELNLQGSGSGTERLFSYVSPELLARPTFSRLLALLDNYEPRTGQDETETAEEQQEQREFLDAALDTPVLAPSAEAFRADLHSMWFGLYSRSSGKALDSSGFEHVFHGEGAWGACPRRCHVSLGGEAATIQTYTWDKQRLVASAYPLTP